VPHHHCRQRPRGRPRPCPTRRPRPPLASSRRAICWPLLASAGLWVPL